MIVKKDMSGFSSDLAPTIRTTFVFLLVVAVSFLTVRGTDWNRLKKSDVAWLLLSAVATTLSWIFYYKALQKGPVSPIASIDKASFLIPIVLGWAFLYEPVSPRVVAGAVLILIGLLLTVTGSLEPPAPEGQSSSGVENTAEHMGEF